jgi:LuxR family maltose regulon positive regulatory protein
MSDTDLIIRTKLHPPFTRPEVVVRPRLQERMAQGLSRPLTLITAPAGFGKTTLVADSLSKCGMPVAWLSLDKDDNQPARFLRYLVAALHEAEQGVGAQATQLLSAPQSAAPEMALGSLINDLDTCGVEIALVLEDYHLISNRGVHTLVAFLLEHCPHGLHMVIASRSDPPLPLARLRARGQTLELRAADLSFNQAEAAQFLNEVMSLSLDAESVALLAERTEGWIAGLQMAALSMRERKDVAGFIQGFSGTNRFILDYLLEEVLASQSPEIQHFLLNTSILQRLSASLCDAVLADDWSGQEQPDPAEHASQSASILDYLERANLFVQQLDDERQWYRYHHLFADLLHTQLQKSLGASGVAQLHRRASEWHARYGSVLEAIHHASLAADDEGVERLIEQNYMEMLNRGEMLWIRSWTGELSKERVRRRPWLSIYEASSHAWFGELDEAERLLDETETRVRAEVSSPEAQPMLAHVSYIRSRVTAMRGDLPRAIELCLAAQKSFSASNMAMQIDTNITLGYEYFLYGDYEHAVLVLNETIRLGLSVSSVINTVASACVLSRLYAVQGRLDKACDLCRMAAQFIPDASGQHLGARALVEAGFAERCYEANDLQEAMSHIKQGLALMPWWGKADDTVLAYLTLARIHLAQAHLGEAAEAVEQAMRITRAGGLFSEARRAVEAAQVRLWMAQGDLAFAGRWAEALEQHSDTQDCYSFENEPLHIARGRVLIAQQRPREALGLLVRLEENARSAGRLGRVLEILLLEALALQRSGQPEAARLALTGCLELAEPQGYLRLFLDEGGPLQSLLAQWLAHAAPGRLRAYAAGLLQRFNPGGPVAAEAQPKASTSGGLVEPLSPRELEVLRLIALGCTNQEIARQLVVTAGTVKAHSASIYRKLEVGNRTEAVSRARQLGILA